MGSIGNTAIEVSGFKLIYMHSTDFHGLYSSTTIIRGGGVETRPRQLGFTAAATLGLLEPTHANCIYTSN